MNFEKINKIVEGQRIYFNSQKTKNIDFRFKSARYTIKCYK